MIQRQVRKNVGTLLDPSSLLRPLEDILARQRLQARGNRPGSSHLQLRGGAVAEDGTEDGTAIAMDMTETLEPSADREKSAASVVMGGDVSASVDDINVASSGMSGPATAAANIGGRDGKGSSYMGSSVGTGSGDGGDVGSGGSGTSVGGMRSSSTVKTYRHPTSSKKRNVIRDKLATALTPFYREQTDKYTPLNAAVAIEHSMYRFFGKVSSSPTPTIRK